MVLKLKKEQIFFNKKKLQADLQVFIYEKNF